MPESTDLQTLFNAYDRTGVQSGDNQIRTDLSVTSEGAFVAAGPPRISVLSSFGGLAKNSLVFPIGIIQGFTLNQSQFWLRALEVGSHYGYMIPGRWAGAATLGRIYSYGVSLMRALYAYKRDTWTNHATLLRGANPYVDADGASIDAVVPPGLEGGMLLNLSSDFFRTPTGLAILFTTLPGNLHSAIYLEECGLTTHNFALASDNVIIAEQAQLIPNALTPIQVTDSPIGEAKRIFGGITQTAGGLAGVGRGLSSF